MGTIPPDSIHIPSKDNPDTSVSKSRSVIQLPQELITEILVRVPVKSLLKFKCVSKPWLSLISHPQFIRSHLSKSSSSSMDDEVDNSHLELLYFTETCINTCSLYSALHEADYQNWHFYGIEFPDGMNLDPIAGIINGLVCLNLKGKDLFVWNPALNKIKHLNIYHEEAPSGPPPCVEYLFSFGYEESNDDYKVVCFQTVEDNGDNADNADDELRIYSLKADSWRRIDLLKGIYLPHPGVFANGKIYWSRPNSKYVSLDMSSEKFAELKPPEYDAGECSARMGVSGGQLFVLSDYRKGRKVDLWVLDKHGVEESWCKLVSIPYHVVNVDIEPYAFGYWCLCISSNNGEIVFGSARGLLVYNWKKKEYRNIKVDDGIASSWTVAAYVESLVWPDYA